MTTELATEPQRRPFEVAVDDFTVTVFRDLGPERAAFERELDDEGVLLPLCHRSEWASIRSNEESWFAAVRDREGRPRHALALAAGRSRVLPGHQLLRVERLGSISAGPEVRAALRGTGAFLRSQPRLLRATIELFSRDREARESLRSVLTDLGFRRRAQPRAYSKTVVVDLAPSEDAILSSFHKTGRYNIRVLERKGFMVRDLTDPEYASRLDELVSETMRRTGGRDLNEDWAGILELSRRRPDLSRVVCTFAPGPREPRSLLAFGWGCHQGDHATYAAAASTRDVDSNVPLTYAPVWDLMRWAKSNGARWFDLGGITPGSAGRSHDPLGGISDFKRYFSTNVVEVREEWTLEPYPLRGLAANLVSAGVAWLGKLRR